MKTNADLLARLHALIDDLAATNPECIDALDRFLNATLIAGVAWDSPPSRRGRAQRRLDAQRLNA